MIALRTLACLILFAVAPAGQVIAEGMTPEAEALSDAMGSLRSGNWDAARSQAAAAGALGSDIVEWHRLRAGRGSFDEVRAFLERRGDWPGLPLLRRRSEGSVPYGRRADDVIAFFEERAPQTGSGSIMLARAYEDTGRRGDAEAQIVLAWRTQTMSPADERLIREKYGDLIAPHDEARLDMLLWEGKGDAAERMLPYVSEGWRALARARIALRAEASGVDALIEAVPETLADHPGLAFERFRWRASKGRYDSAIEVALSREAAEVPLGHPGAWARWRAALARWAMRNGQPDTAYRLASAHGLTQGSAFADLEWLSGFIALRQLDDPELALFHFQRFRVGVQSPISLGRAGYWEGRAHEALGQTDAARQAYAFGAEHQTSFYGLLAAERIGAPMDPALTGTAPVPDWQNADFLASSVFEAAILLRAAGQRALSERFLAHLAESLDQTRTAQLAQFTLDLGEPHFALTIAKRGVSYGNLVHAAYFPVVDLGVSDPRVPLELALSIARRESEFDAQAVSGVGARGLMQVMPRTAEEVAEGLELDFSAEKLTSDPVYNATLGKAYLAELIERFGHNYVLVAAAYNAGPSRPLAWIGERGDPRSAGVDVVDWIELIPFTETRNYVMRVMESLPVYRARLTGEVQPIRLAEELSAR